MEKNIIKSTDNPKIKAAIKLSDDAKTRKKENLIFVEGEREVHYAIVGNFKIQTLFYCEDLAKNNYDILEKIEKEKIFYVDKKVFKKLSYRENGDGYLALVIPIAKKLDDLKLSKTPLLIVLEKVEKPGNLGAILRTADGCDADAIILCDQSTDIYNPNVIRASQGTIFTKQLVSAANQEAIAWLKEKNIKTYGAVVQAKKYHYETNLKNSCALVFGTEDKGLSREWRDALDEMIKIPMNGQIDSLNVSNSVAIISYEALRQRGSL